MAKARITEREVNTLRTASRRTGKSVFVGYGVEGLGLCISANGLGTWLVQKWIGGRRGKLKRVAIGYLPPMTVEEARSKARSERCERSFRPRQRSCTCRHRKRTACNRKGSARIPPHPLAGLENGGAAASLSPAPLFSLARPLTIRPGVGASLGLR
jgi:hypothetical protein